MRISRKTTLTIMKIDSRDCSRRLRIYFAIKATPFHHRRLRLLSGRGHEVYTGLALLDRDGLLLEAERTTVFFRDLCDDEIIRYVRTGEPMDKAGAYGIQGKAALFVRGIEGDYYNVVGLPVCRLGRMLNRKGVPVL